MLYGNLNEGMRLQSIKLRLLFSFSQSWFPFVYIHIYFFIFLFLFFAYIQTDSILIHIKYTQYFWGLLYPLLNLLSYNSRGVKNNNKKKTKYIYKVSSTREPILFHAFISRNFVKFSWKKKIIFCRLNRIRKKIQKKNIYIWNHLKNQYNLIVPNAKPPKYYPYLDFTTGMFVVE